MTDKWRLELKQSIRTVDQLSRFLKISQDEKKQIAEVIEKHPMRITRYYMSLINRSDPDDPIRRMVVPSAGELDTTGKSDTSGESANTVMPGLQHKYAQTALILATNRCAAYCRYCFRKRMVGLPTDEILRRFNDAIAYVRSHREITNVLISGGDPLVLSTDVLEHFLKGLSRIDHVRFIRFGTKAVVTLPRRLTEDERLIQLLREYALRKKTIVFVTHINHSRELNRRSIAALKALKKASVVLYNQAVLLKGVNDDPHVLADLQMDLLKQGVNPYYVFQCRPAKRVKREFQLPLSQGWKIVESAKEMLSGPSKSFRYVMSHRTGKIEIIGAMRGYMYFKYHQAKSHVNVGKFFRRRIVRGAGWLDDMD